MSVNQSAKIGFDFTQLNAPRDAAAKPNGAFALQMAQFQSAALNNLISSAMSGKSGQGASSGNPLFASNASDGNPLYGDTSSSNSAAGANGLNAAGRNMSLCDPESGYKMMSLINKKEISYQAEFAALTEMKGEVTQLQHESEDLAALKASTDNTSVHAELQQFVDEYNTWVGEFDDEMRTDGALANSNAAKVSRYELGQSITSPFNGAKYGLQGMQDLGITIDPVSKLARLDGSKLDSVLAENKTGAIETIQSFSANFAKSAQLLNASDNFIANRLGNLDRVIHYLNANKVDLQAEFGLGDTATPSANIAQALAAYKKIARA